MNHLTIIFDRIIVMIIHDEVSKLIKKKTERTIEIRTHIE